MKEPLLILVTELIFIIDFVNNYAVSHGGAYLWSYDANSLYFSVSKYCSINLSIDSTGYVEYTIYDLSSTEKNSLM